MNSQIKPRFTLLRVLIIGSIIWTIIVALLFWIEQSHSPLLVTKIGEGTHVYYQHTPLGRIYIPIHAFIGDSFLVFNGFLSLFLVPIDIFSYIGTRFAIPDYKLFIIQPMALTMIAAATWGAYKIGISKRNYWALALIGIALCLYVWYLLRLFMSLKTMQFDPFLLLGAWIVLVVHFSLWYTAWKWYRRGRLAKKADIKSAL